MKRTVAITVYHNTQFLLRIVGIYVRRGLNIDSMFVGNPDESGYSRVVITALCDEKAFQNVVRQLEKQIDVAAVQTC